MRRLRQSGNQAEAIRHYQEQAGLAAAATPASPSKQRAWAARPCRRDDASLSGDKRFLQGPSVEIEGYRWEGTLRAGAKVSPACRSFGSEYRLTDTVLGTGMSGTVLLATPRHRFCVKNISWEDLSPLVGRAEASASELPVERTQSSVVEGRPPRPATSGGGSDCTGGSSPQTRTAVRTASPGAPQRSSSSDSIVPVLASTTYVAVKTLEKKGLTDSELQRLLMEVDIYLKMDHVNIAKLLRVFSEPDKVYLVMEYCSGGSLCDRLLKSGPFGDQDAAIAVRQVLSAVNYCHCHPEGKVCHRDLKHSNFIYTSDSPRAPLKLVDFGLSRILRPHRPQISSYAGTLYYMAPEVVLRQKYDESCDLWSVGVIAYSLLCGEPPFQGATDEIVAKAIATGDLQMEGQIWAGVSDTAKAFCRSLLRVDPASRPTAEQAMQHPWVLAFGAAGSVGPEAPVPLSTDVLESIVRFAHESAARRMAAALIVYSCGVPRIDETAQLLEAQFQALDADGDGTVSLGELEQALRVSLGVKKEEAEWIFEQLDYDGDAKLHHSEFLAAAMGTRLLCRAEAVREAFSRFDLDSDGKIDLGELLAVLGPRFCGKSTQAIFEELDTNGDRGVDLDEFSFGIAAQSWAHQPFQPEPAPEPELPQDEAPPAVAAAAALARSPVRRLVSAATASRAAVSWASSASPRVLPLSPGGGGSSALYTATDAAAAYLDALCFAKALSVASNSGVSAGRRSGASPCQEDFSPPLRGPRRLSVPPHLMFF